MSEHLRNPSELLDSMTLTLIVPRHTAEALHRTAKAEGVSIDALMAEYAEMMMAEHGPSALDEQEGGSHYKDMDIQPVEYIHANGLPFIEGCIVKYASRHKAKNGAEDVRKIIHFARLLLKLEYGEDA